MSNKKKAPNRTATRKDGGPADLRALQAAAAKKPERTLLESWQHLLANIEKVRGDKIDQESAARTLYAWPHMDITQVRPYFNAYYDFLLDMRQILESVIDENPGCLMNIEDDAAANESAYLNIYLLWNQQVVQWTHEWDIDDPNSYVQMAAQAAAQEFFIGNPRSENPGGLIQHLSHIGIKYDDADATFFAESIREFAEEGERE